MADKKKPFDAGIQKHCPMCEGIMMLLNDGNKVYNVFVCPSCGFEARHFQRQIVDGWLNDQ